MENLSANAAAFIALKCASDSASLPLAFHDDLHVHDRNRLGASSDPIDCFGWVLRECGTLLLDARMDATSRRDYRHHVTKSDPRTADRFYFWDGCKLACMPVETMFERMAECEDSDRTIRRRGY